MNSFAELSHKDVSRSALLPAFIAGTTAALVTLVSSSYYIAKKAQESWDSKIEVSWIQSLNAPEIAFEKVTHPTPEIEDRIVIRKAHFAFHAPTVQRKSLKKKRLSASRKKEAPLSPELRNRVQKIVALALSPIPVVEMPPAIPEVPADLSLETFATSPEQGEYSKILEIKNLLFASILGDLTTHEPNAAELALIKPRAIRLPVKLPIKKVAPKKIARKKIIAVPKVVISEIKAAAPVALPVPSPTDALIQVVESHLDEAKKGGKNEYSASYQYIEETKPAAVEPAVVTTQPPEEIKQTLGAAPLEEAQKVVQEQVLHAEKAPEEKAAAEMTGILGATLNPVAPKENPIVKILPKNEEKPTETTQEATSQEKVDASTESLARISTDTEVVPPAPEPAPKKAGFIRWLSNSPEDLAVATYGLNQIPTPFGQREWLVAKEERSFSTVFWGSMKDSQIPLVNRAELETVYRMKRVDLQPTQGLILVRLAKGWKLKLSEKTLKDALVFNSDSNQVTNLDASDEARDVLLPGQDIGSRLVSVQHVTRNDVLSIAIPVLKSQITFVDLTQERKIKFTAKGRVDRINSIDKVTEVKLLHHGLWTLLTPIKPVQSIENVTVFGEYPLHVDAEPSLGFKYRFLVQMDRTKNEAVLEVNVLNDDDVQGMLKNFKTPEGGISSESSIIAGKVGLRDVGTTPRVDPSRYSRRFLPEVYLYDISQPLSQQHIQPVQNTTLKHRHFVAVQIPEGLTLLSLEKPSGERVHNELHVSSPRVINIYQPE